MTMSRAVRRSAFGLGLNVVLMVAGASLMAQDWPQFLGPQRNGQYDGPALARRWPGGVPPELWRRSVGAGFAGSVVADARLVLFHRIGGEEVLEAFDAATGEPIWRYAYATTYRDDFGFDEGPRSSPMVGCLPLARRASSMRSISRAGTVSGASTPARGFGFARRSSGQPARRWSRTVACSRTSAAPMPALLPSMPARVTCCGRPPGRRRATHRRWRRRSAVSGMRCSSPETISWRSIPRPDAPGFSEAGGRGYAPR